MDRDPRILEPSRSAFGGTTVGLGAAIGVATFPADGGNAADLLAHADRGMYAAKGARNGSLR